MTIHPFLIDPAATEPALPSVASSFAKASEDRLAEEGHRLAWRDIPINQLSREQMIQCIEGLYRNINALRDERDNMQTREQMLNGCGND